MTLRALLQSSWAKVILCHFNRKKRSTCIGRTMPVITFTSFKGIA